MSYRACTILATLSMLACLLFAMAWAGSFQLEYFPPGLLGFKWHPTGLTTPLLCDTIAAAIAAAAFAGVAIRIEYKQIKRRQRAQCTQCGYDLRATPDRCPECGKVPTSERHARRHNRPRAPHDHHPSPRT